MLEAWFAHTGKRRKRSCQPNNIFLYQTQQKLNFGNKYKYSVKTLHWVYIRILLILKRRFINRKNYI